MSAEPKTGGPEGRPSAEQAVEWRGHRLDDVGGASVGKIEGVYVAEPGGAAEWLLARMGRFGHHTHVPARDAVAGVGRVWVPYGRDQVRRAPRADPKQPLTAAAERALLAHYGVPEQAGRGAELSGRADDEVSARRA